MKVPRFGLGVAFVSISSSPVFAQGRTDYFNVESPQVKPIAVARIVGHDYVLACNTPDNALEVWDTDENVPIGSRFVARVRVGLEPVSVKWNPVTGLAYTANFLGDSISVVGFTPSGATIVPKFITTTNVGDEPMDIAFSGDGNTLYVTHNTPGTFGVRDAASLAVVSGMGAVPLDIGLMGLKEPRAIAVSNGKVYVLGFKGGNTPAYDFDVYLSDLASLPLSIGGLGSTNFNMAFASNGDLWVVGAEAQNSVDADSPDNNTEAGVANDATGFVRSTIYLVRGGSATGTITKRDLNALDLAGTPVAGATQALAQPTDVIAYQPPLGSRKIIVAAFGSDRLGVLTPSNPPGNPYLWPLSRVNVPPLGPSERSGPRGLAIKYSNPAVPGDPDRLYVMNRLDNSVSIFDPQTLLAKGTFKLKNDPTPDYIRQGRKFLYSAEFSGNKFVSCASCHMDGRLDSLTWMLGDNVSGVAVPDDFAEGRAEIPFFAPDKGAMATQSLQGLLNYEVDPPIQDYFTNAPYHWRGDRSDFTKFNGAFVGLLGMPNIGTPTEPRGIAVSGMERFRTFINSIHYPPNPYEPLAREFTGTLGDLEDDDPLNPGTDALRGLKLFHVLEINTICNGRSCVQCHFLPEGGNGRGTDPGSPDLIETAATRGLFQKEARRDIVAGAVSDVVTSDSGLTHIGAPVGTGGAKRSVNAFIQRFQTEANMDAGRLFSIQAFMRQFDWGPAPLIGSCLTVGPSPIITPEQSQTLDLFEAQAGVANAGLAVHARIGGSEFGYWYDSTLSPAALYRSEDVPTTTKSRAQLLAQLAAPQDRLTFLATPLGSERRVASVTGITTPFTGAPSNVSLLPVVPNTAYAAVPSFKKNWDIQDPMLPPDPNRFHWLLPGITPPTSLKAIRLMQHGLKNAGYGLTDLRHEAPRRFRLAGTNIKQGASLYLYVLNSNAPPIPSQPPELNVPTILFKLPIYPTDDTLPDGRSIWETAVEIEPYWLYALMLGGPNAPGMPAVLDRTQVDALPEPPNPNPFDPANFNFHYVRVRNPDGQTSDDGWQHLTVQ